MWVSTRLPLELWLIPVQWSIIDKETTYYPFIIIIHPFHIILLHRIMFRVVIVYCTHFISYVNSKVKSKRNYLAHNHSNEMVDGHGDEYDIMCRFNGIWNCLFIQLYLSLTLQLWVRIQSDMIRLLVFGWKIVKTCKVV